MIRAGGPPPTTGLIRIKQTAFLAYKRIKPRLAQLFEQRSGDFDAIGARIRRGFVPALARQPHAFIRQDRCNQSLDAFEIDVSAGQRARINREQRMADR